MRVRNISIMVLCYVKIHRKRIGKTIVVHNLKTPLCVTYSKKILTQLYKIPRKLNMSYGTQKFTFLKCSTDLKYSVSLYKQML